MISQWLFDGVMVVYYFRNLLWKIYIIYRIWNSKPNNQPFGNDFVQRLNLQMGKAYFSKASADEIQPILFFRNYFKSHV